MPSADLKILIIGHVWPEPSATAAGKRMLQLLHFFKKLGYQLTFVSAAEKSDYTFNLTEMDIREESIILNDSSFDRFAKKLSPHIVIYDRFMTEEQYGWRISEVLPNCLQVLNTEDLHSLRAVRQECLKDNTPFSVSAWLQDNITKRELASIYRSDLSLIISKAEMKLLMEDAKLPGDILFYLPFLLDSPKEESLSFKDRSDFVFIGNGRHKPNLDAINWLRHDIWPQIRKELPMARLNIYGAYLPDSILSLNNPKEGFLVRGWIENSSDAFSSARVNFVPLRFGAGLKGKLMEAMVCGTPSIGTSTANEGIYARDLKGTGNFDDPLLFAKEAVRTYSDKEEWLRKQQRDRDVLESEFSQTVFSDSLNNRLQHLLQQLVEHRMNNTVGSLLRYHTAASTKYMSKWIELKNKKTGAE